MLKELVKRSSGVLAIISLVMPLWTMGQIDLDRSRPKIPDIRIGRGPGSRGANDLDKLAPGLRALYDQFTPSRGGEPRGADETGVEGYTSSQLSDYFGIASGDMNPTVTVSVHFNTTADIEALKKTGAAVIARTGQMVYAVASISQLGNLSGMSSVYSIGVFNAMHTPSPILEETPPRFELPGRGGSPKAAVTKPAAIQFNKQGLTGKGVIIGVIDTGIDWRHEDFIRPDGTSRILAIWDPYDNSYQNSNGATGSKPPVYLESKKTWLGTVYTNDQINAALKGTGAVNSFDKFGHGTAVAGTAASNGRATANGIPGGTYDGVAPDADLLVVKASDCGSFLSYAELTAEWMTNTATALKRPVVINMSFGSQFSSHDGTTEGERFIDQLTGPGKPGRAITVSAGNDARYSLHASGKFGAKRAGQEDNIGQAIELYVKQPTTIMAAFDSGDDWGIVFRSNNEIFQGADGKQTPIYLFRNAGTVAYKTGNTLKHPEQFDAFMKLIDTAFADKNRKTDLVQMQLPAGNYILWGFGASANVPNGKVDIYSVESAYANKAIFGIGTEKTGMVSSPGNAKNAITVGSYDFRDTWENLTGETAFYNLTLGGPSAYSSPGFRRDGLVKPDINSPARYTISSLSQFSKPVNGGCKDSMAAGDEKEITRDGFHIAWQGTSASSPFTAGVIALMLQKNPMLDAEQIRQILRKTARKDGAVGAVPNAVWGWGMIDPAAAIIATPRAGVKKPVK